MRIGPGLLVTAAFIGPGTITTATLAGGTYGYSLLWALLFSVVATIVLQTMSARLGIVTGAGLAEAFKSQIQHPAMKIVVGALIIAAIGVGNSAYQTGNLAGAALGASEFTGLSAPTMVAVISTLALVLLLLGKGKLLEGVLVTLVALMAILFIATMIVLAPSFTAIIKGLTIPSIPSGSLTTVIALIGTTVVPYNLFLHASLAAERWHDTDRDTAFKESRNDMIMAAMIGGLITLSIIVAAAIGLSEEVSVAAMAQLLSPILGEWSERIFGLGLFAAGLTSALAAPIAAAFAVCGVLGLNTHYHSPSFKIVAISVLAIGTGFAYFGDKPMTMILIAQAANGMLLPIAAVFLVWLMNRHSLLGDHKNTPLTNLMAAAVLAVVIGLSLYKLAAMI